MTLKLHTSSPHRTAPERRVRCGGTLNWAANYLRAPDLMAHEPSLFLLPAIEHFASSLAKMAKHRFLSLSLSKRFVS